MKNCFIYVSQVPRVGTGGQNKFEKCFIETLLKKDDAGQNFEIKVFSVSSEGEKSEDERLTLIPLSKKNYTGFILHQFRLFCNLGGYLWSRRKKNVCMFVRYHPAMLAPLIFSYLFGIRLSIRTGPVLPSIDFYNKNPGVIVFHCIKWVLGHFYRKASSIVTVTEKTKEWITETYTLDPQKILIIPNAADTTLVYPEPPDRRKWGLPENEFVFGFVGTINEEQGLSTILHALGHLNKSQEKLPFLFIAGDGNYRLTLKSLSVKLNIVDHIIWAGNIPHEQVRSAINACDMMLAPYQKRILDYQGSSALKLWEYLACDKSVLASASKDHQFLEKFKLGKMVEADNIDLWAKTLAMEAKGKDFLLRGRGEKFVLEKHSYEMVVEKFISISFGSKML